jgi:cytochrome P450
MPLLSVQAGRRYTALNSTRRARAALPPGGRTNPIPSWAREHLMLVDPPDHARLRRIVSDAFTQWAHTLNDITDLVQAAEAHRQAGEYVEYLAECKREIPAQDLMTVLAQAAGEGIPGPAGNDNRVECPPRSLSRTQPRG